MGYGGSGSMRPSPQTPLDARDFAVLGRVALLSGLRPFPDGIDHALDVLRVGAEADACELFLLDHTGEELLLVGCTGPDSQAFATQERFDVGQGFPGIVANKQEPLTSRDLAKDPRFLRSVVTTLGYKAFACAPVVRGDRLLGTIHLAWKRDKPAVDRGLRLLDAAGPTIATNLVASFADLLLPPESGEIVSAGGPSRLAERFRIAGRADAATVILIGPEGETTGIGSSGTVELGCSHVSTCVSTLQEGRCVVLRGDRSQWSEHCRELPEGFARVIAVPMVQDDRAVGVAFMGYEHDSIAPHTRRLGALRTVADDVALHIRPALAVVPTRSPASVRLRLRCLGPFAAFVDGRELARKDFGRAKAIELLKVLVMMRGCPISRDALVERLWPDKDLKAGARNLHVAMHALRRAVEPEVEGRQWVHIRNREDMFFLDLRSSCFVDVEEVWRLLAQSHPAPGSPVRKVIRVLERIHGLYRGRLFADDPEAEWCAVEREALHGEYVDALVRLADLGAGADSERAISLLRQATLLEPLREDVQRELIRSLWTAGRRHEARDRYQLCIRILREELDVAPAPATLQLGELVFQAS